MRGNITDYANLEITTGKKTNVLRFYVANMGGDNLVLGYLWFAVHNPQLNWAVETLSEEVEI